MAGAVGHLEIDMMAATRRKWLQRTGAVERYPAVE